MRADAERSVAAILDAAIELLSERPEAGIAEIARVAGVTRQTVYAHFASREALVYAVGERALAEAVAALDDAKLDEGEPTEALERLIETSFQTARRHRLFDIRFPRLGADVEHEAHQPLLGPLDALIRRGQRSGAFDRDVPAAWLGAVYIALAHAAAEEIAARRLDPDDALRALKRSTLLAFGARRGR